MLITASDYARLNGKSKQWVCRMLRDGRIDGAQRVGHAWMVPMDALMPGRKVSTRVEAARVRRAAINAEMARRKGLENAGVVNQRHVAIISWIASGYFIDVDGAMYRPDGEVYNVLTDWTDGDAKFYETNGGIDRPSGAAV